jgi:ubiquitin C-terminal hydrolase
MGFDEDVKKSLVYNELPPIQIYNLTRFDVNRVKIETKVNIPLVHQISAKDGRQGNYVLTGFTCHSGGVNGGHYVSYGIVNGEYFLFDDSRVVGSITAAGYLEAAKDATAAVYSRVYLRAE